MTRFSQAAVARIPSQSPGRTYLLPIDPSLPDTDSIIRYLNTMGEIYSRSQIVRSAAVKIIEGMGDNNQVGWVNRITDFVKSRLTYVPDPVWTELVISPDVLLTELAEGGSPVGDCDDHVLLLNSLLGSIGIPTMAVGVKLYEARFDHVISCVYVEGRWKDIDPCAKDVIQPIYSERLLA